jgi:molybdenum cofactor guanylyltransferase
MTSGISGVILAGGAGTRFNGIMKPKIVVDGETILSRTLSVISSLFDEIIIVTNNPEEFKEFRNYKIVRDEFLHVGPLGGIHAALKASSNDAIFVFAGDMPFLDKELINRLISVFRDASCDVLIPRIGEFIEPLHSIFSRSVTETLEDYLRHTEDFAVRDFIKHLKVKYLEFTGTEENKKAFANINSASDII